MDEAESTGKTARRRVGRPSEQVLSRKMIIETALRLLDEHGQDGFGMRDIASELGVRPSALYNHVDGKDDIFRGIRELIGERITGEMFDTDPWDAALIAWAREYRDAFAAHPPTIALLAVMPFHPTSSVSVAYDRVIRKLTAAGWSGDEALNILVSLESFILGSALDAAAAPDMMDPGPREDVPGFSAAYRARQRLVERTGTAPADLAFETGLRLFLNGLRAERPARGDS
ncbi:TetR/AcrR family transcriptional regulator [Leucobacter sp.]